MRLLIFLPILLAVGCAGSSEPSSPTETRVYREKLRQIVVLEERIAALERENWELRQQGSVGVLAPDGRMP